MVSSSQHVPKVPQPEVAAYSITLLARARSRRDFGDYALDILRH
jgi:hypothetical protein